MARSPANKDWVEKRSIGRREADRSVCIWHDVCHETVSQIKQDGVDNQKSNKEDFRKMEKLIDSKLPAWVFKLFLATTIPLAIALGGWIGLNAFETGKIVTRIDTNQRHLMRALDLNPVTPVADEATDEVEKEK